MFTHISITKDTKRGNRDATFISSSQIQRVQYLIKKRGMCIFSVQSINQWLCFHYIVDPMIDRTRANTTYAIVIKIDKALNFVIFDLIFENCKKKLQVQIDSFDIYIVRKFIYIHVCCF